MKIHTPPIPDSRPIPYPLSAGPVQANVVTLMYYVLLYSGNNLVDPSPRPGCAPPHPPPDHSRTAVGGPQIGLAAPPAAGRASATLQTPLNPPSRASPLPIPPSRISMRQTPSPLPPSPNRFPPATTTTKQAPRGPTLMQRAQAPVAEPSDAPRKRRGRVGRSRAVPAKDLQVGPSRSSGSPLGRSIACAHRSSLCFHADAVSKQPQQLPLAPFLWESYAEIQHPASSSLCELYRALTPLFPPRPFLPPFYSTSRLLA